MTQNLFIPYREAPHEDRSLSKEQASKLKLEIDVLHRRPWWKTNRHWRLAKSKAFKPRKEKISFVFVRFVLKSKLVKKDSVFYKCVCDVSEK